MAIQPVQSSRLILEFKDLTTIIMFIERLGGEVLPAGVCVAGVYGDEPALQVGAENTYVLDMNADNPLRVAQMGRSWLQTMDDKPIIRRSERKKS